MTTCSVAASSASRNSWRSSLRGSRSPVQGPAAEDVVAVDGVAAREDPVVEADQADHAVRHRAHRDHRADRQRAGAEVGPRRPPGQPRPEQRADVGEPQLGTTGRRRGGGPGQLALELRQLPRVVATDLREVADPAAQRVHPLGDRGRRLQPGQAVCRAGRAARPAVRRGRSRCCRRRRAGARARGGDGRRRSSRRRAAPGRGRSARCCWGSAPSRTAAGTWRRAPSARGCRPPSDPAGRGRRR